MRQTEQVKKVAEADFPTRWGHFRIMGFERALANGSKELQPMADQFYGDRSGSLLDAWGNHWYIATHMEDLTPDEIAQRAAAAGRR